MSSRGVWMVQVRMVLKFFSFIGYVVMHGELDPREEHK